LNNASIKSSAFWLATGRNLIKRTASPFRRGREASRTDEPANSI
jgi:hypothetical protein